jgi:L-aminopeptidase/D-esterase-like protein
MMMTKNETLTAVAGLQVGHWTDTTLATGCTVVLCPPGTVGGVDQRGGAPGTRETDLLRPMHLVNEVHAVVLSGGSAFGLSAADGVMRYLREQGVGFPTGSGVAVPIVPAAILYDLEIGKPEAPNAEAGYAAASGATTDPVAIGNVGAGTGCTVGKLAGMTTATKGGLGSAAVTLDNGLVVAALFAVNAVGDVVGADGAILAGLRDAETDGFVGTLAAMQAMSTQPPVGNTVIGIVATNAVLSKENANKIAGMAHDGLARAVVPAHTMYDGDTIFSLATGDIEADVNLVGALAAEVSAAAIRTGVLHAATLAGVRAIS